MCDYSLEHYSSRPARVFERYETMCFPSGSIGLAAPGDCNTAVCVQYGTPLMLAAIPTRLRENLSIGESSAATFKRLSHGVYRDGVRFPNGREVSIQQLGTGVQVVLVEIAIQETEAPAFELA
jgi:hypothetical protein